MSTATSPGLQQRVERLEHAAKSDRANLSAEAAEFAYRSCYAKQAAGETVDFAAEHKKVLSELQANPQSVRARYAKENSYKPDPFPNIQRGAPGDTIQSYESLGDRISRIAKRRAGEGADSQILDQVKRQVHQEIFEALDKKINSQRAAEIYAKNDDEYLEFASAHGSMSSRASAMAIRRCKGQLSGFQEAYSDALDELRREWATRD